MQKITLSYFVLSLLTISSSLAQADAFGVFVENGKFGLKAEDETVLLEAKYEYIYQHPSSFYLYFEAKKGQAPEKFDPNIHFQQKENQLIVNAPEGTSFGIIAPDFGQHIKPKYTNWSETLNSNVQLFDGKLYYFLDLDNITIINKKGFQAVKQQASDEVNWAYKQKNKWGMLQVGNYYLEYPVKAKYEDIQSYRFENETIIAKNKGKWGVIALESSKPVLDFQYDEIAFNIYTGRDQELELASWLPVRKGDRWGLYYQDFDAFYKILNIEYDKIIPLTSTHLQVYQNNKMGIIAIEDPTLVEDKVVGKDPNIKTILPLIYDSLSKAPDVPKYEFDMETFDEILVGYQANELLISHQNGKKGLISSVDYSTKLSAIYDNFDFTFNEKIILVQKDGKYGIWKKDDFTELYPTVLDKCELDKNKSNYITIYQNNKKGVIDLEQMTILLPPIYDDYALKTYYTNSGLEYYAKITLDKKKGLIAIPSGDFIIDLAYEDLLNLDFKKQLFCVQKNNKVGIIDINNKIVLPIIYDTITAWKNNNLPEHIIVKKDNKVGVVESSSGTLTIPLEWDELTIQSKNLLNGKKGKQSADIDLTTKSVFFHKNITEQFSLKWKTKIGITTFRTNMMMANGVVLVGSNGTTREQVKEDKLDGLFLLNPKDGKILKQLKPINSGDDDVNGVAVSKQRLYFGGDNDQIYCFDFKGEQLWNYQAKGDIEGSPVLFDINNDRIADAIFAVESPAQLLALDGKTGKQLWVYESTYSGYFMATPTAHDLNGDNIPDVLIGLGGGNQFLAVNGKNGKLLWDFKTLSSAGFVDGSAVHASATVLLNQKQEPYIVVAECYGLIHFLNKEGKLERYTNASLGLFSSPSFSANGSFGFGSNWNKAFKVANGGNLTHWQQQDNKKFPYWYIKDKHESNFATVGAVSASPFVADVLGLGDVQFGVADEYGFLYLTNQNGKKISKLKLPAGVEAPIFIKDIDNDGKLELLISCLDGYIYCFDTQSKGKIDWGQFRKNNQNISTIRQSWW